MNIRTNNYKKILLSILWVMLGAATVVLSVAAMKQQEQKICKGVEVNISGVGINFFIDKADVLKIVNESVGEKAAGKNISSFDLAKIEKLLKTDVWVDDANLYFDNNNKLQVSVEEREPVARVFTKSNQTFYIDSAMKMLPLSEKFSARLPVFTSFPSDAKVLLPVDSNLLFSIREISKAIQADPFLMGMIDQVDITAERDFELTPKIGDQLIFFGDGSDVEKKFNKLKLFYKKVIMTSGWNKYRTIDLQYDNQVVAKLKGKEDVAADSLKTLQLIDFMAKTAALHAEDSVRKIQVESENTASDISSIQHSVERDEGPDMTEDNYPIAPVVTKTPAPIAVSVKPAAVKPVPVSPSPLKPVVKPPFKAAATKQVSKQKAPVKPALKKLVPSATVKPKVVMPRKNEY